MTPLPPYIQAWHDAVHGRPERFCKAIHQLADLVEKLLDDPDIRYDPSDVEAFESFCRMLRHKEGRWSGLPFELEQDQKYVAACVLGIKCKDPELKIWVRYFREMILIVARKWGKSTFISALGLYMECADMEPAAQVWCLATQKEQAEVVFHAAVDFAASSPALRDSLKKRKDTTGHRLVHAKSKSYMKAGTKDSKKKDGLNPHAVIIDELHAIRDRNTYDVMSSAMGARTQPLIVIISTAGFDRESIYDQKYAQCKQILNGELKLRIFPMIFEIDEDDDPDNPECWVKANPGIGSRPTMGYLAGEYEKAKSDPTAWPSFLAKHLNRPCNASVIYFDLQAVDSCADDLYEDMIRNRYAVGGVDLAETTDLCCATAIIPVGGRLQVIQRYFIASSRIEQNSKADQMAYESFQFTKATDPFTQTLLQVCDGPMVRKRDVMQWYRMLVDEYDITFWKIGYDRWHGDDWVEDMKSNGFSQENDKGNGVLFECAMGPKTLSEPMKETRVLFKDKIIKFSRHNGLFRWCTTNTAAKIGTNKEIQPDKAKSKARIDGYVSFLIAYIAYKKVKDMFELYQE